MNELIALLQKAYDDGIITSIILTKILKVKNDLKLSDAEFNKIDDQIRVTTYLKKVDERKEKGIVYFGDLTKQYRITEEDKELLKKKKSAEPAPAPSTKPSTHSEQAAAVPPAKPAKAPVAKQEKTPAAVPAARPDGDFVLIVDDNPNHVKLTKTLMEKNGFVCDTADSPHEALKIVLQKKPMLILCDFNFGIGKQTGLDLLHELKSKKMTIPFIIISAYFQKEFVDYAFGIGVTDYLTKPIEPEELLATIKKHLGAKK
jgi:CheY-like chemotaxis protein